MDPNGCAGPVLAVWGQAEGEHAGEVDNSIYQMHHGTCAGRVRSPVPARGALQLPICVF